MGFGGDFRLFHSSFRHFYATCNGENTKPFLFGKRHIDLANVLPSKASRPRWLRVAFPEVRASEREAALRTRPDAARAARRPPLGPGSRRLALAAFPA